MKRNSNILSLAQNKVREKGIFRFGGGLFKTLRVSYFIATAYSIMMCIVVLMGNLVLMSEYADKSTAARAAVYDEQRIYMITMILVVIAMIVAIVGLIKRIIPLFLSLSFVNLIVAFTVFYGVSVKNDIQNGGQTNFWMLFGVPSIACAVLAIALGVILIVDRIKVVKEYDSIVSKLYKTAEGYEESNIDTDDFETLLDNYDGKEVFRNDIPLKKSLRKRKEKQEKE